MIRKPTTFVSATALAAALSMAATPAAALDMPAVAAPADSYVEVNTGDAGEANQWRRYRRHRHRGVDAGDVIAGVVVVGALAAIIGSASSRNRNRDRYEHRRERVRYDDRRDRNRGYQSRGIESAVDMCVDQVEYRDNRVENVDRADRSANGWNVTGTLSDGERWSCSIDNAGEVRSIEYGATAYSQAPAASSRAQLSDAAYRNARTTTRTAADEAYSYESTPASVPADDGPRPAYPGGPLPGEEGYDDNWQVDADLEDGRYTSAQASDYTQAAR